MNGRLDIKVCGMTRPDNISAVTALAPSHMGFIFHEPSPRNAIALDPAVVRRLPAEINAVAVMVNRTISDILAITERYGFTTVQLHGNESPWTCSVLAGEGLTVWKAISIDSFASLERCRHYRNAAHRLVLDTASMQHGGTGEKWDWRWLRYFNPEVPCMLAGGIGPTDAEAIMKMDFPWLAGVDLNSRFETAPGIKDITLLTHFINTLRS